MTTKPKARKFRIKRSAPSAGGSSDTPTSSTEKPSPVPNRAEGGTAADQLRMARAQQASASPTASPTPQPQQPAAQSGEVSSAAQVAGETDMDAIRREGLTGRQLRMARRVAQKHELAPTSDFDAVRLLREKGIDPFQRSNMLELVVPQAGGEQRDGGAPDVFSQLPATAAGAGRVQLPQTIQTGQQTLPSTDVSPAERRSREISDIQRDISSASSQKDGPFVGAFGVFRHAADLFGRLLLLRHRHPDVRHRE